MVGGAGLGERARLGGDRRAHLLAGLALDLPVGRVAGQQVAGDPARAEWQRHRDVRVLVHPLGQLERATADVGDEQGAGRPAEPAAGREEGQPRLVLTAQHVERDAGALDDGREHVVAVRGLADGAGDEAAEVLHPLVLGHVEALLHEAREPVSAGVGDQPVVGDVLGEAQVDLVLRGGQWLGAGVCVDDEEVDRVRSDVDDPEAHAPNVVAVEVRP